MSELEKLVEVTITLTRTVRVACPGCGVVHITDRFGWNKARSGAVRWPALASQLVMQCPDCGESGEINDWREAEER